jgi:16S rRNA (adenine1518-N6/adenine1519-N6)-dimethyltransferase
MELAKTLKKSLGQHLLKDKNLLAKMVRLARITADERVLEIGPGHGDLTKAIAECAQSVDAIELDERFREILRAVEEQFPAVRVTYSDIMKIRFADFAGTGKLIVMGNIPYNVTGDILFKLLSEKESIKSAYLTMQMEVAERLVGRPHSKIYGALSVIFQLYATMHLLMTVKSHMFLPPPKVDSAYISIVFRDSIPLDQELIDFIKSCFRYKRKYLRHSLQHFYNIGEIASLYRHMSFGESIRAEEISPDGFVAMYRFLRDLMVEMQQKRSDFQ